MTTRQIDPSFEMGSERHLHHAWCNFSSLPRDGCRQCDHMFANYPDADIGEYFSDAIVISDPNENVP